jgi:hypothetical protein
VNRASLQNQWKNTQGKRIGFLCSDHSVITQGEYECNGACIKRACIGNKASEGGIFHIINQEIHNDESTE